ncbi:MAG TPA: hypothetical protein VFS88_09705 [Micavibrio sp.]|nr:hypothetical protein [Micavibrio sp.]
MDEAKSISDTFGLYGLGDGSKLFDDYLPVSDLVKSFTKPAADASARTGEDWKPAAEPVEPAVLQNFRDMIFSID